MIGIALATTRYYILTTRQGDLEWFKHCLHAHHIICLFFIFISLCPFCFIIPMSPEQWVLCKRCMAPSVVWFWIYDHMTYTGLAVLISEVFTSPWTSWHYLFVPAEGLPHPVSGAGAGEPQSGAGNQKQTAPPARKEADGDRQTGETWGSWKWLLGIKTSKTPDKAIMKHMNHSAVLIFFSFQKEKNVQLDESLKKVQQQNEDLRARMDKHAALSR